MDFRYCAEEQHFSGFRFGGGTVGAMTLGDRIRAAIEAKHLSQAWVAEEVGMTPAALSNIVTGVTRDPSFFTVLAIARVIKEPLSAIVDDPRIFWTNEELARLRDTGEWLVKRVKTEHAGTALEVPPRRKGRPGPKLIRGSVAATSGGEIYPDAFELPNRRIPKRYKQLHADAVFSVQGESMTGESIFPGDLLYVHRTRDTAAAIGRIVVCSVDNMIVVKRLTTRGRKLVLQSAHDGHKPMTVDEDSSRFRLTGIVVGTSRT
ncbi:MAG: LexA family transcriptional regulator [Thermoanaerobaculia bacterium]